MSKLYARTREVSGGRSAGGEPEGECVLFLDKRYSLIEIKNEAEQDLATAHFHEIEIDVSSMGYNEAVEKILDHSLILFGDLSPLTSRLRAEKAKLSSTKQTLTNFLGLQIPDLDRLVDHTQHELNYDDNFSNRLRGAGVKLDYLKFFANNVIEIISSVYDGDRAIQPIYIRLVGSRNQCNAFISRIFPILNNHQGNKSIIFLSSDSDSRRVAVKFQNTERMKKVITAAVALVQDRTFCRFDIHHPSIDKGIMATVNSARADALASDDFYEIIQNFNYHQNIYDSDPDYKLYYEAFRTYDCALDLLNFWFNRNFNSLLPWIILYFRSENEISEVIFAALAAGSDFEVSKDLRFSASCLRSFHSLTQIRKKLVRGDAAIEFLHDILNQLHSGATRSRGYCLYQLAYYHFQAGEIEKAIEYCERSNAECADLVEPVCLYAAIEILEKRTDHAKQLLVEAANIDNGYEFVHYYVGNLEEDLGDHESAAESYIKALLIRPNFYQAALNLSNVLAAQGRILDSARFIALFLARYSAPRTEFYVNLAVALFETGHSKDALELLKDTYEHHQAPLAALNISKLYLARAQTGPTMDWTEKVLSDADCPDALKKEARLVRKATKNRDQLRGVLNVRLLEALKSDDLGSDLAVLILTHYSIDDASQDPIVETVRRAIWSKPIHPKKYVPKTIKREADAIQKRLLDQKHSSDRHELHQKMKEGRKLHSNTPLGRRRLKEEQRAREVARAALALVRAPSYSAG